MGNHMCPVSCRVTPNMLNVSRRGPMQVIIGYSMPPQEAGPSMAVIEGQG